MQRANKKRHNRKINWTVQVFNSLITHMTLHKIIQ